MMDSCGADQQYEWTARKNFTRSTKDDIINPRHTQPGWEGYTVNEQLTNCMCFGMCIGIALSIAIGFQIGIGIAAGLVIGVAVGGIKNAKK